MAESQDSGRTDSAILSLIVEFRQLWDARGELRTAATPPATVPPRRVKPWGLILVLCAASASAYFLDVSLVRPSGMLSRLPWVPRGQTATRPATSAPSPPLSPATADQQASASNPSTPTVPLEATARSSAAPAGTSPAAPAVQSPSPAIVLGGGPAPAPGYHVQVGAFNVRAYAQDLVDQLRSHDYSAAVVDVPTGPPHRVWITGVFDRGSAERLLDRLRTDGFEGIVLHR